MIFNGFGVSLFEHVVKQCFFNCLGLSLFQNHVNPMCFSMASSLESWSCGKLQLIVQLYNWVVQLRQSSCNFDIVVPPGCTIGLYNSLVQLLNRLWLTTVPRFQGFRDDRVVVHNQLCDQLYKPLESQLEILGLLITFALSLSNKCPMPPPPV